MSKYCLPILIILVVLTGCQTTQTSHKIKTPVPGETYGPDTAAFTKYKTINETAAAAIPLPPSRRLKVSENPLADAIAGQPTLDPLIKRKGLKKRKPYKKLLIGRPYKIKGITYIPQKYHHYNEVGIASWYGGKFHGRLTANGEVYDKNLMTAAHKTLPLPTWVTVTQLNTGKKLVVRVNDRGPYHKGRIIDLSRAAAEELGIRGTSGLTKVRVRLSSRNEIAKAKRRPELYYNY